MARDETIKLAALGGVAWGIYTGSKGALPPQLQAYYDKYIGRSGSGAGSGGGGTGGGGGSAGCWDSTKAGIPACVGVKWCQTHNAPPQSIDGLNSWGNQNGYRNSTTGAWSC